MRVLLKKLVRMIWHTKSQFLAVTAVVTLGITVFISMTTAYYNLNRSKDAFYAANHFADYTFQVVRAPQQVTKQIEAIPGVMNVSGRIQKDLPLITGDGRRATARLITFQLPQEGEVNQVRLLSGSMPEKDPVAGGVEALVDKQYADGNRIDFNDEIAVIAAGKKVALRMVGTATGPEFVYPIKDAATLVPDPTSFAIVLVPLEDAQSFLEQKGEINQIVIRITPGADEKRIVKGVEEILKPYGNLGSFPQIDQLSNAVLKGELDGLKASARVLPVIFMLIAAFIQFVMLGRMVKAERQQIGLMKSLGISLGTIRIHYTAYGAAVGLAGAILGTIFGILLASVFSRAYAMYFNLPSTIGGLNYQAVIYGFLISLGVSAVSGLIGCRGVVSIQPAESMRPEPPKSAKPLLLERTFIWRSLDPTWKMSLRSIARNKTRFAMVVIGILFATGLLIIALFTKDSVDYMIQTHYHQEQSYDYLVHFTAPLAENELYNLSRMPGVLHLEPLMEVPVKIHYGGKSADDLIVGLSSETRLRKIISLSGENLHVPESGIIIDQRTAKKIGVTRGDTVRIETLFGMGPTRWADETIVGISKQLIGGGSFMELNQINGVLREGGTVSGAMLKVDPGLTSELETQLGKMNNIASFLSRQKEVDNFNKNMSSMFYTIGVMVLFAVILGFAIVYNASAVSFAERKRELASLRVVGFSLGEVSSILWKEYSLQSLIGIILGLPSGYLMAKGYVQAVSTDLYVLPVVVYPLTYFISALGGLFFVSAALLFTLRGVRKLDLVDVLKQRD